MLRRWRSQSKRQRRMNDAAKILLELEQAGDLGAAGIALRRHLQFDEERLDMAIKELCEQGLIKEITYSKPNTWALRNGFTPRDATGRRWRLTTHGREVVANA